MFRENHAEVLERHMRFMDPAFRHGVMLNVSIPDPTPPEDRKVYKPLEDWDFPRQWKEFMDVTIERQQETWRRHRNIDDELLPSFYPCFGIAEHSAFVGGKVSFGGDTSYHEHPVTDWSVLDTLACHEDNENFSMLMNSMRYLKERSSEFGYYCPLRGVMAPMDMANAMRGNDIFMDFYEEPEEVHRLIRFCQDAGKWFIEHQFDAVGEVAGGTITGWSVWIPGHSVGHVAEDASSMCSLAMYEEFGLPYTRAFLEDYDTSLFHIHSLGRHVLPAICSMDKVSVVQLTTDPNQPSPISVSHEYDEVLKSKIIMMDMTRKEIEENLDFLRDHKVIINYSASSEEDGLQMCELLAPLRIR